jgi:hypothetical protein
MVIDSIIVCTADAGVAITNTASLTPTGGTVVNSAATLQLVVFGCNVPPDVTFQELTTWGAQTFSWQLQNQAKG